MVNTGEMEGKEDNEIKQLVDGNGLNIDDTIVHTSSARNVYLNRVGWNSSVTLRW